MIKPKSAIRFMPIFRKNYYLRSNDRFGLKHSLSDLQHSTNGLCSNEILGLKYRKF